MAQTVDPYYEWLGIPPKDQPANHYRLLGVELFEENRNVIDAAANRQMGFVKAYQAGEDSDLSQKLLNELAAARLCLLTPDRKAAYDAELQAQLASKAAAATPVPSADDRLSGLRAERLATAASPQPASGSVQVSMPAGVKARRSATGARRGKRTARPKRRDWIILAVAAAAVSAAAIAVGFVVTPILFPQPDVADRSVVKSPEPATATGPVETAVSSETPERPAPEPTPYPAAPEPVDEPPPAPPEELAPVEPAVPEQDPPQSPPAAESLEQAETRLQASAQQASSPAAHQAVAQEVLALADRAIVDSEVDVAKRLAALALKAARKAEADSQVRDATLLLIDLDEPLSDEVRERARQRLNNSPWDAPRPDHPGRPPMSRRGAVPSAGDTALQTATARPSWPAKDMHSARCTRVPDLYRLALDMTRKGQA